MTQQAGIKDIAKRAGVSTATVSRTLRNPQLVSVATKEKVMTAVNALNYRPNQMGSNLRTKRTGNIVVIIPDITNPFNAGVIRAIEQVAQTRGYSVLLGDTQGDEIRIRHYAGMVASRQADGIILFSQFMPFVAEDASLLPVLPPLVNSCEDCGIEGIHKVMIDNRAAAIMAVNHLIGLGHRRIACITGPTNVHSSIERLTGYQQALKSAGIDVEPQWLQVGDYQLQSGIDAAQRLLSPATQHSPQKAPTAIFCFNDEMAMGAMSLLQRQGYRIPQDISIIGFDDIRFAQYTNPSLTTIRQPVEQIGRACIDSLIKQMSDEPCADDYIELAVELVKRESTAKVVAG
ncbi:MAG: LacI family repressor for deo operon, udp, cdd, tsx, nupC, and nupG [Phenylobacterium sp.]|jgi:LacI family repressor for deo operon, udp, cdd, tsx, nupC, and nupG